MKMNSFNTNTHDIRSSKRKCLSLTGCLIFVLLMSQTSCRPSETETDTDTQNGSSETLTYNNDQDYMDADDIDWKTFAAVETTSKVHPIIFYKEDIVSEDYDPSKEKNKTSKTTKQHHVNEIKLHHRRKYKEISRHHRHHRNQTESYRYIKPEKVYFDINPIEHRVKEEGASNEDDSKFNEDDIHVEVISLLNEDNSYSKTNNGQQPTDDEEESNSKHLLNKMPKKYNHRSRREVKNPAHNTETRGVSLRHKRNPFYHKNSFYSIQLPHYRGVFFRPLEVIYPTKGVKHPIKSPIYHNPYSPGGGNGVDRRRITTSTSKPAQVPDIADRFDDSDRPVWPIIQNTRRPATQTTRVPQLPPRRTQPPIIQKGDEDFEVPEPVEDRRSTPAVANSVASSSSNAGSNTVFRTTRRPVAPAATRPPVQSPPPQQSRNISACIWAISACCTMDKRVRYQCFERQGCFGSFWDLNPCAEEVVEQALKAADQYLE